MIAKRLGNRSVVLAVVLAGAWSATAAASARDEGLVAYWNFDEGNGTVVPDLSGHGNNGECYGSPTWSPGACDGGLELADQDMAWQIPSSWDDSIAETGAFSVAAWVYWYGPGADIDCLIFDGRDDSWDQAGFAFYVRYADGQGRLTFHMNQPDTYFESDAPVPTGAWTHVAVVFDNAAHVLRGYVNGQLETTLPTTATYHDSDLPAAIGNNRWAPGDGNWAPLNGVLDELRIYDQTLNDSEVFGLYQQCASGLVAYWNFDEGGGTVAYDSSGSTPPHNGMINGATWTNGACALALDFDGVNDYAEVPDSDALSFGDGAVDYPFTISAWVKLNTPNSWHTISSKYNHMVSPPRLEYVFSVVEGQARIQLFDVIASTSYQLEIWTVVSLDTQWHHVAATYDGSSSAAGLKLYIDGSETETTVMSNDPEYVAMHNTTETLKFGAHIAAQGMDGWFNGRMDEVHVYNQALSESEVFDLYQQCAPGLVAHWNLDEGSGNVVHDVSGHGNDATFYSGGSPTWSTGACDGGLEFMDQDMAWQIQDSWDDSIAETGAFSVAAWVYWYGPGADIDCLIFDGRDDWSDQAGFAFYVRYTGGQGRLTFHMNQPDTYFESSAPVCGWTHLAVVFDNAAHVLRGYVNGQLDTTLPTTATYNNSSHPAAIGNNHWADGNWGPLNGVLDELRIYDRALSDSEIVNLYDQCEPPAGPGDMNCDGVVSFGDINPFVLALQCHSCYVEQYPNCRYENADCNCDGYVDFTDIDPFVELFGGE